MRFEELLHWNDGQFLQPHHFQHFQRLISGYNRINRSFCLPYAYGLLDFELDLEALEGERVVIKRFSAIMPDGLELSMPGNCILKPLDLTDALKEHPDSLAVSIAAPLWSEFEGNLADEGNPLEKKLYLPQKKHLRDENSGDNEISVITRRINARLITGHDDAADMQTLPILKLKVITQDAASRFAVRLDDAWMPPFMMLTADDPLLGMADGLLADTRRCRNKLLNDISAARSKADEPEPDNVLAIVQLRTLNLYDQRLSSLLVGGFISPFALYLELSSFLAELMGLNPMNGIREIAPYDHDDSLPQFTEIIKDIRSFILSNGGAGYVKLNFSPIEGGEYLFTAIKTEDIVNVEEIYLAVRTGADEQEVVRSLEYGDTFKLINPKAKTMRIRGMKLTGMRYPPRFLPVLDTTLWFKLDLEESARVWRDMCE